MRIDAICFSPGGTASATLTPTITPAQAGFGSEATITELVVPGTNAHVTSLNDRGQIVGSDIFAGTRRPFLLTPRRLRSLSVAQPKPVTLPANAPLTLSVDFEGTSPISYQWNLAGNDVPGATNKVLSLEHAQFTDTGLYTVVISDAYGQISSQPALVTVLSPPVIAQQPRNITPLLGTTAGLEVKTWGTQPITYQWQRNGTNITGATNSILTLSAVSSEDSGSYRVVIQNQVDTTTSDPAAIRVIFPPSMSLAMYAGIAIEGEPGQPCRLDYVEALGNTADWRLLTRIMLTNRSQIYFDTDSPSQPKRYYRVVLQP